MPDDLEQAAADLLHAEPDHPAGVQESGAPPAASPAPSPLGGDIEAAAPENPPAADQLHSVAAVERASELPGYYCPECGGRELVRWGRPSMIDQEYRWRCSRCDAYLGTKRPTPTLVLYLVVCVASLVAIWVISGLLLLGQFNGAARGASDHFAAQVGKILMFVLVGAVLAPLAVVLVARDLRASRPRKVPRS